MNLLFGTCFDPAVAVTKATSSLLAMTAIDTAGLRASFVVPPSGMVRVRMAASVHGATTFPTILLGVMDGATVMGRQAPVQSLGNTAVATAMVSVEADFVVNNLTPGRSVNWDAAYAVQTVIAATGLKYGGPNNISGNNAFGGFLFEVWDPCPAYSPLVGSPTISIPPTTTLHQKIDTVDDFVDTEVANIQSRLPAALVSGRMDSSVGAMASGVITSAAHAAGAIDAAAIADGAIDAATLAAGTITSAKFAAGAIDAAAIAADAIGASELAADAATEIATAVWAAVARTLTAGTNIALAKGTGVTGFNDLDAAAVRAALGLASANLDTQLAAIVGFIDTEVAAILAAVDTEVAAIKSKTDNLPASPAAAGDQMALTAAAVDAILDDAVEGTNTVRQLLRGFASALLGKASGLALNAPKFRDLADSKDRITVTSDASGNRTAVTLDLT